MRIPIEVSARHIHLSKKDLETLFGRGYRLKKDKSLYQNEEFLAVEKLDIEKGIRKIENVALIGPSRGKTQVELSHTDMIFLKIKPIVRDSGDIARTPGAVLSGPKGRIKIKNGVINTWRHIHCSPNEAKKNNLKHGDLVSVRTSGKCSITFHNVRIKVGKGYKMAMHLDTDEGNAACITKRGGGVII